MLAVGLAVGLVVGLGVGLAVGAGVRPAPQIPVIRTVVAIILAVPRNTPISPYSPSHTTPGAPFLSDCWGPIH
ncbi:hypothetical protein ACFOY2_01630 [Nonomuraea purpurea]|uniref:Uncharacterized protein n=1 Tax=Nonomuraea purpurea TaxID=1849276 RepID=A0ABV8FZ51_9ACTN